MMRTNLPPGTSFRLISAALLAALANTAQGQTFTYTGVFRNFNLNLAPLARGYGLEGEAVLSSAFQTFSEPTSSVGRTFVQGWTDCINSQSGMSLVSMTEPVWSVGATWTDGDPSVLPLPNQYPNGDGFVQEYKWKVQTMKVSGGKIEDAMRDECTSQAFAGNAFLPFLRAADTDGMFATVTEASAIALGDFTPQHEWTHINGEGKVGLEFFPTDARYGPATGAVSVTSALNGPGFYPIVSEAWRKGIEEEVPGSRVYSVGHYYTDDRTFITGQFFGTVENPGNLVDQTVTDRPSVITDFPYAFRARWWKPIDFSGDLTGTAEVAVGTFDGNVFTPYLKEADDGNHFADVTETTAAAADSNPPPQGCALDVSMTCTQDGTDVDCNDIPTPIDESNCRVPIRYSYYFRNNGPADAKLVSAIRNRTDADPEERRFVEDREGTVIGAGFVLDTWEMDYFDLCTAGTYDSKFEVKTANDGGLECSRAVEYQHVIDPNVVPTPAPVPGSCDLSTSVSCATTDGVECNDVVVLEGSPCNVQVEYQYTVRNVGSFAATFSKLMRTRNGAADLDFLGSFPDPFELGVPPQSNFAQMKETIGVNFCSPGGFQTTFVAEASSDGGTNVCAEMADYLLTVVPSEPVVATPSSAGETNETAIDSEPAVSIELEDPAVTAIDETESVTVIEDDAQTQPPMNTPDLETDVLTSMEDVQPTEDVQPMGSPSPASIGAHFAGGIIGFVACIFFAV